MTIAFIPFKSNVDIMSPENICRPVPDNYNICGASIIDKNGVKSDYIILKRANGEEVITDCKVDQYPYGFNSSGYHCADGIWKVVNHD